MNALDPNQKSTSFGITSGFFLFLASCFILITFLSGKMEQQWMILLLMMQVIIIYLGVITRKLLSISRGDIYYTICLCIIGYIIIMTKIDRARLLVILSFFMTAFSFLYIQYNIDIGNLGGLVTAGALVGTCLDVGDNASGSCHEDTPVWGLTPREAEVFGWLLRGYSLRTIAGELGVSFGTIDTHVRHIYQKAEVHSREELFRKVEKEFPELYGLS